LKTTLRTRLDRTSRKGSAIITHTSLARGKPDRITQSIAKDLTEATDEELDDIRLDDVTTFSAEHQAIMGQLHRYFGGVMGNFNGISFENAIQELINSTDFVFCLYSQGTTAALSLPYLGTYITPVGLRFSVFDSSKQKPNRTQCITTYKNISLAPQLIKELDENEDDYVRHFLSREINIYRIIKRKCPN